MATLMGSIIRAASRKSGPLNILTFPTHERYETGLCLTGHKFYAYRGENIKDWDTSYAPLPPNYILLNPNAQSQIPLDVDFDLILCQNKFGQYPVAKQLAGELHLPLVCLEHTLPMKEWGNSIGEFKQMKGNINIFISEYSRDKWGWKEDEANIIHHGIDTDMFSPGDEPKQLHALSVVNDFANRDWCCGYNLWKEVTTGLPTKLVGNNPGLSKPASSVHELVQSYRQAKVFLNTSLVSPIPTVLLEAMSCGCAIVSTDTCMIPEVIEDGKNGFLCSTAKELRQKVELLLEDNELNQRLGSAARQTILDNFNMQDFIANWQRVFDTAKDICFTGE